MTTCKCCAREIADSEPVLPMQSRTHFEVVDGWRIALHWSLCSVFCLDSMVRREREALSAPRAAQKEMSHEEADEKYPDAFRRKKSVDLWG